VSRIKTNFTHRRPPVAGVLHCEWAVRSEQTSSM